MVEWLRHQDRSRWRCVSPAPAGGQRNVKDAAEATRRGRRSAEPACRLRVTNGQINTKIVFFCFFFSSFSFVLHFEAVPQSPGIKETDVVAMCWLMAAWGVINVSRWGVGGWFLDPPSPTQHPPSHATFTSLSLLFHPTHRLPRRQGAHRSRNRHKSCRFSP